MDGDPSIQVAGFEVADRDDLDQAATELEKLGHAVHVGTREEADARMVRDFIGFSDPTGNRIEIAWRPAVSGIRYHGTRDAGITGFSHIGLCTTDPVRDEAFWTQVCNARVSDRIGDAALLRIDEVHHSIALFPTDRAGIQHINHQVETADDIMRSLHFLNERRVRHNLRARPPSFLIGKIPLLPEVLQTRTAARHLLPAGCGRTVFDAAEA